MSAYNGSGVFTLTGPEYPAVAASLIQSAYRNALDSAIATGLSTAICRDGQSVITANIPFNGFKLTGIGAAAARTDAASLATIQDATGVYVAIVGGTANAITLTPTPSIAAYAAGQRFQFIASGTNSTTVVVDVSSLGAKLVTKHGTTSLVSGDILSGALVQITYDGTRFQLDYAIAMTQAEIGLTLYPQTAAELSAGVTPTAYQWPPGHTWRYGMAGDAGTTTNDTAFQNCLNANAGAYPITIPRGLTGYYKLTGRVTAPANTQIIMQDGAELRWTATTATGTNLLSAASRPGIEITGDNFSIEGCGTLRGPSSASYVANEMALLAIGTSTTVRKSGFRIGGAIEFSFWGSDGWALQFVDNIDASGFYIHDVSYAGWRMLSCSHFDVYNFHVKDVTPGTGAIAYGFACTHDATNYSTDPNIATPRLVANPFCIDGRVHHATIENVDIWDGYNAHGGYELEFHHINTYNCRNGGELAGSSGGAVNYSGENCSLHDIVSTTRKRDGSATTIATTARYGCIIAGGSTVLNQAIQAYNITLDGYGDTGPTSYNLHAARVSSAHIYNITIRNWKGRGIYTAQGDGVIEGVVFEGVADATNSACIYMDTGAGSWTVANCRHQPVSGTAAAEGLRINSANSRCLLIGNDFGYATTPYIGFDGTNTLGDSQIIPQITVTGTPTTVDLSPAGRAPRVQVFFNTSGGSTVTDFTNAFVGQVIECHFPTANVTVVDRTNAALAGGANFSSTIHDTLVLKCRATSGVKFIEYSRSANS